MKYIFIFLGFLIPFPLFFDAFTGDFLIARFSEIGYLSRFGAPVPIGFLSFLLISLLLFITRTSKLLELFTPKLLLLIGSLLFLNFFQLNRLDPLQFLLLLIPLFLLVAILLIASNDDVVSPLSFGYFISFSIISLSHFISIIIDQQSSFFNPIYSFNHIFDFTVYQALVSYSAVLSFASCLCLIYSIFHIKYSKGLLSLLMFFIISSVVVHGGRKAFLLDLACVSVSLLLPLIPKLLRPSRRVLIAFFATLSLPLVFSQFGGYLGRAISISAAQNARGGAYIRFLEQLDNSTIAQLLFGDGTSLAGLSNLFLSIISRLGFIYAVFYFILILLILSRFRVLFVQRFTNSYDFYFSKSVVVFIVLSVLLSNFINMNFILPYYTVNVSLLAVSLSPLIAFRTKPSDLNEL